MVSHGTETQNNATIIYFGEQVVLVGATDMKYDNGILLLINPLLSYKRGVKCLYKIYCAAVWCQDGDRFVTSGVKIDGATLNNFKRVISGVFRYSRTWIRENSMDYNVILYTYGLHKLEFLAFEGSQITIITHRVE